MVEVSLRQLSMSVSSEYVAEYSGVRESLLLIIVWEAP